MFASGSPFDPWTAPDGKTYYPGQGNNAYIFPGVSLGVILCGVRHITDDHFLIASNALADCVTAAHLAEGRVYPPLADVQEISVKIATAIAEHCYADGTAAYYPEPEDKQGFIRAQLYNPLYQDFVPEYYDYPEGASETTANL